MQRRVRTGNWLMLLELKIFSCMFVSGRAVFDRSIFLVVCLFISVGLIKLLEGSETCIGFSPRVQAVRIFVGTVLFPVFRPGLTKFFSTAEPITRLHEPMLLSSAFRSPHADAGARHMR